MCDDFVFEVHLTSFQSISENWNYLFINCNVLCNQLGKAAFQRHNDPLDAALFYLAMKKKAVLWGLFR